MYIMQVTHVHNTGNMAHTWHKSSLFVLPQRMQLCETAVGNVEHELLWQFVCVFFLHIIFVMICVSGCRCCLLCIIATIDQLCTRVYKPHYTTLGLFRVA